MVQSKCRPCLYLSITGRNDVVESNVRMVLLPRTTIFSRVTRRIVSSPLIALEIPLRNFGPCILFIPLKLTNTFFKLFARFFFGCIYLFKNHSQVVARFWFIYLQCENHDLICKSICCTCCFCRNEKFYVLLDELSNTHRFFCSIRWRHHTFIHLCVPFAYLYHVEGSFAFIVCDDAVLYEISHCTMHKHAHSTKCHCNESTKQFYWYTLHTLSLYGVAIIKIVPVPSNVQFSSK